MKIESVEQFTPETVATLEASMATSPRFDDLLKDPARQPVEALDDGRP
jgi:hypothetical protein